MCNGRADDFELRKGDGGGRLGHAEGVSIYGVYASQAFDHLSASALTDEPDLFGEFIVVCNDTATDVGAERFFGVE